MRNECKYHHFQIFHRLIFLLTKLATTLQEIIQNVFKIESMTIDIIV